MKQLALALLFAAAPAFANDNPFAAIPEKIMNYHKMVSGDNCTYAHDDFGTEASVYDIGHDFKLYIIPCNQGAYQTGYRLYNANNMDYPLQMMFVDWSPKAGVTATLDLVGADYDAAKKRITAFSRGRSMADCGSEGTYKLLVEEYIVETKVVELRYKGKCDGKLNRFPKVFPK